MIRSAFALAVLAGLAGPAAAQQAMAAAPAGVRGDIIGQLDFAADRIMQLARAMPKDKYTWRPGPGVRSPAEVFAHVAGGNYLWAQIAGVPSPVQLQGEDLPAPADSAQALDMLRRSFDHLRNAIRNTSDADLEKQVQMFGRPSSIRAVYLLGAVHAHEHLGQLIAYARTNGVVPPWSRQGGM